MTVKVGPDERLRSLESARRIAEFYRRWEEARRISAEIARLKGEPKAGRGGSA